VGIALEALTRSIVSIPCRDYGVYQEDITNNITSLPIDLWQKRFRVYLPARRLGQIDQCPKIQLAEESTIATGSRSG
jgi:hypothetical protein